MQGTNRTRIMLEVDDALCHACKRCLAGAACRGKAFRILDRGEPPFIDTSRCWGCLVCVAECPFGAVKRHDYTELEQP